MKRYSREKLAREAQLQEAEKKLQPHSEAEAEALRSQALAKEEEWKSLGRWLKEKRGTLAPTLGGFATSSTPHLDFTRAVAVAVFQIVVGALQRRQDVGTARLGVGIVHPGARRRATKPSMKFH